MKKTSKVVLSRKMIEGLRKRKHNEAVEILGKIGTIIVLIAFLFVLALFC